MYLTVTVCISPGAALLACKLLRSVAKLSEIWHENELVNDLKAGAE